MKSRCDCSRFRPTSLLRETFHWSIVRREGHPTGQTIPFIQVHRQVPQARPPTPTPSTGVDYLGLVHATHDAETVDQLAFSGPPSMPAEGHQAKEHRG